MRTLPRFARIATSVSGPKSALRSIRVALYRLPFRLGITSLWPGSYIAWRPDRYSANAQKAARRSGLALFKNAREFIHHNQTNNAGDLARFYLFNLIFEQIVKENIGGDVAELGVYKGNTAVLLARFARARHANAYLFDTFQGFSKTDITGVDAHKEQEFEDTSIESVKRLVGTDNIRYVVGYFPDSTAGLDTPSCFCLVHLDCDLYMPMKAGLEYFYPRLAPGGFLLLHDYSSLYWDGAERAIDEFLADKRERIVPIPDKSGTAVLRKL